MGFGNTTNPTPGHLSLPDGGGWEEDGSKLAGPLGSFWAPPATESGAGRWEVSGLLWEVSDSRWAGTGSLGKGQ